MTDYEFSTGFTQWASTGCAQLLGSIPSGSGICRVVGIEPSKYSLAYVSTAGGSFKRPGEHGNWYAPYFELAKVEARISGECIYEYSRMDQDTPTLNCYLMPQTFIDAVYGDRDLPTGLHEKSQIVIDVVRKYLPQNMWSGVYFPTRRGDGGIFMFDRNLVSITTSYTGDHVPTPQELG